MKNIIPLLPISLMEYMLFIGVIVAFAKLFLLFFTKEEISKREKAMQKKWFKG